MGRERIGALREAWSLTWSTRLVVWGGALAGLAIFGRAPGWERFDPGGVTTPFGALGDVLVAPVARWDATWFLAIADDGYDDPARTAFFPLYPLAIRVLSTLGVPPVLAAVAISAGALVAALAVLRRLVELELGPEVARRTVLVVACFPGSLFLTAAYSDALFLALSAGAFYAARTGAWPVAGGLGALAAATRSVGVLLAVPLALLWWGQGRGRRRPEEAVWIAAVPAGLLAYVAYLGLATGEPLAPFRVQEVWFREVTWPLGGAWDGAVAAFDGARQLLSGSRSPVYFTAAGGDPYRVAVQNLGLFAFLVLAAVALAGAARRLPPAYPAWAGAALALPLTTPVGPQPLMSLPRFMAVLFPLHMAVALWAGDGVRLRVVLGVSLVLLAGGSAAFACWEFVA